ncbi:Uncharacterised protein [Elizabethkingia miricola]|nr:Uncharacterised protein [Elizabethkingia miricola]
MENRPKKLLMFYNETMMRILLTVFIKKKILDTYHRLEEKVCL